MDVVLVFGDSGISNRSDMENLSRKRQGRASRYETD